MKALFSSIDFHSANRTAMIGAMVFFVCGIQFQEYRWRHEEKEKAKIYLEKPASDWLDVQALRVPDFVEGDDPLMLYISDRKATVTGQWTAVIRQVGGASNESICDGAGRGHYKPTTKLPDKGVSLSWFMGKRCVLKPAQYVIELGIEFTPEGHNLSKTETAVSNVFTVKEKPTP